MSDNEQKEVETNPLQEVGQTVTITPDDVTGASEFWTHFSVPMPSELKDAFAAFVKEPTFANQQQVKFQVCKAIGYTDHEAFNDEMFKEIVEECRNVTYDMGFDDSIRAVLSSQEEAK